MYSVCALLCYLHSAIFSPTCDAETAFTPLHLSFVMSCSTKRSSLARGVISNHPWTVAVFVLERTFSSLARNLRVESRMNRTRESVGEGFGPQFAPRSLLGVPPTIDHRQERACDGERRSHGARESFERLVYVRRRRGDRERRTNVSSTRTAKLRRRPSESNRNARRQRSEYPKHRYDGETKQRSPEFAPRSLRCLSLSLLSPRRRSDCSA